MEHGLPAPPAAPPQHTWVPAAAPGPKMPQESANGTGSARCHPPAHSVPRFSKLGESPSLPLCSPRERTRAEGRRRRSSSVLPKEAGGWK